MTDRQAEAPAFCWATELAMTQQPVTLSVTEAREVSAGMQRLHAENITLQAGYAAARLEIESLRMRSVEPADEYPALPEPPPGHHHHPRTNPKTVEAPRTGRRGARRVCAEPARWRSSQRAAHGTRNRRVARGDEGNSGGHHMGAGAEDMSTTQQPEALRAAAQAVIDRWDTPLWKDAPATAGYIAALREALEADRAMRAAQPAGAQQPDTAYAELPSYEHQRAIMEAERNASLDEYSRIVPLTSTESMIYERAFTNGWNRHASHGQAPAQTAPAAIQCVECNSCGSVFEIDTYMAGYTEGKGHCLNCHGIDSVPTTQPAQEGKSHGSA